MVEIIENDCGEIQLDEDAIAIRSVAEAENNTYERQRPSLENAGGE